jgi:hypothetical protein
MKRPICKNNGYKYIYTYINDIRIFINGYEYKNISMQSMSFTLSHLAFNDEETYIQNNRHKHIYIQTYVHIHIYIYIHIYMHIYKGM